jgi:hypothetical protein
MTALADLEAGWRLRSDQLPWNVGEAVLRALLRAQRVRPSPGPLRPEIARLVRRDIHEGMWTAAAPAWVNPSRSAPVWWLSEDWSGRPLAMPCVVLGGEVVPTGPVLHRRRRGKLA